MGPRDPRNGPIVEGLADRLLKDRWLEDRLLKDRWPEDRLLGSEDRLLGSEGSRLGSEGSRLVSEGSRLEAAPMVAVDCCNRTGVVALVRKYEPVVRRSVRFRKAVTNRAQPALKSEDRVVAVVGLGVCNNIYPLHNSRCHSQ